MDHFSAIEYFALQQRFSNTNHCRCILVDDALGAFIALVNHIADLLIDLDSRGFAVIAMLGDFTAKEDLFFFLAEAHWTKIAHAPFADHLTRQIGGTLNVVAGAGGDVVHELIFGDTARHQNSDLRFQILFVVAVLIVKRQLHGQAKSHATRNDRDLMQRIGFRN